MQVMCLENLVYLGRVSDERSVFKNYRNEIDEVNKQGKRN